MSSGEDTISAPIKRYLSIGRCIYCGNTESKRGEEHIVPRAIAGNAIIFDDASCRECEKMINKFEQPVLAKALGGVRRRANAPSRRRKGVTPPTHFPMPILSVNPGSDARTIGVLEVPAKEYPVLFIGLRLRPPPIIAGTTPTTADIWTSHEDSFVHKAIAAGILKTGQGIGMAVINPYKFAQLLTKIAYCYATAEIGYGNFVPLVHPILKGDSAEALANLLVGGDYDIPEAADEVFFLDTYVALGVSARYLCVKMRLWAYLGTPVYRVVVGTV